MSYKSHLLLISTIVAGTFLGGDNLKAEIQCCQSQATKAYYTTDTSIGAACTDASDHFIGTGNNVPQCSGAPRRTYHCCVIAYGKNSNGYFWTPGDNGHVCEDNNQNLSPGSSQTSTAKSPSSCTGQNVEY